MNLKINPYEELQICDIEKDVEAKFISILRAIFVNDKDLPYSKNEKDTKVIISAEYLDKKMPFKSPQIVLSGISFTLNMQFLTNNNYANSIYDENKKEIGKQIVMSVPYNLQLTCYAEGNLSRDLANKVANYISYVYRKIFDEALLGIAVINKSATRPNQQYPEKIFETTLSIQGSLQFTANTYVVDISREDVLEHINIYLKEIQEKEN